MPSDKKRINLTVSDSVYEKIQRYKEERGISNDASACLQLIVQQLKAIENGQIVLNAIKSIPTDTLLSMSHEGLHTIKSALEKQE